MSEFDFDYIVIGSGFGGSVSAMRLAQKGYKVAIIESGKRWKDQEFAKRNWNLRKFLWMPHLGLYGIQRMNILKDIFILSGSGVGGGSLNYANTLYVPPDTFFNKTSIKKLGGKKEFLPYYTLARKMLGVTENSVLTEQDDLLKETAKEFNKDETFSPTPVGVYFGDKGKTCPDPYFFGEGPERMGCELCGSCMTGCRLNGKNTLEKNYLYFAEKFGTKIYSCQKVIHLESLDKSGSKGYKIKTKKTIGFFGQSKGLELSTKGVVIAAGALGTLSLLLKMKNKNILPNLSEQLGQKVRTNSEAIIGVRSKSRKADFTQGVAITSSIFIDKDTHIEPVRYGKGHDAMSLITVLLTDGGGKVPRWAKYLLEILKHPIHFFRSLNPFGWAKKSIILLVMQTCDNHLNLSQKRRWLWPFKKTLISSQSKTSSKANPVYIPIANKFARLLATKTNSIPMSNISEVLINAPLTAHIMGGCSIGENSVIDNRNRVNGYHNMYITDSSQIPENLGVNPALSITAFAERAMSFIPPKDGKNIQLLKAEREWGVSSLFTRKNFY